VFGVAQWQFVGHDGPARASKPSKWALADRIIKAEIAYRFRGNATPGG